MQNKLQYLFAAIILILLYCSCTSGNDEKVNEPYPIVKMVIRYHLPEEMSEIETGDKLICDSIAVTDSTRDIFMVFDYPQNN